MKADTRRVLAFILAGLILAIGVGVAVWRAGAPGAVPTAGTSPEISQTAEKATGSSTAPRGTRANVKSTPNSPAAADRSGRDVALATDDPFLAPHAVVNTSRRQADPTRWFRPGNISDVQVQADGVAATSVMAQPPAAGTNLPGTPVESPGAPTTVAVPPAPGGDSNRPAPAPTPDRPKDNAPVLPPAPAPVDTPPVTTETTDKEPTDIVPPTTDTPVATATPTEAPTTPAEPTPTATTTGTTSAPLTTTIDSTPVEPVATATPTPVATQTAAATATPTPSATGGPSLTP